MIPTEPSTRESSSMAVTYSTYPIPAPPSSCGNTTPISPSLPSSLMVASGNSPASSHLRTLGAISRCANSRTLFLSCSCSSLSWKSKAVSYWGKRLLHHSGEEGRNARTDRLVRDVHHANSYFNSVGTNHSNLVPEERHIL